MYKNKTHLLTDRVEKISFDAYDECSCLKDAAERYRCHSANYLEAFSSFYLDILSGSNSVTVRLNGNDSAK